MKPIRILILLLALTGSLATGCATTDTTDTTTATSTTGTAAATTTAATSMTTATSQTTAGMSAYADVTPAVALQLMEDREDLVVIDVSPNYAAGHLPGAVSYYLGDGSLDAAIPLLDKTVPYLVYCHSESVAIAGAQMLIDAGFEEVYRLSGNYAAWVDAGYDIET